VTRDPLHRFYGSAIALALAAGAQTFAWSRFAGRP
jgi:hypothetical protein